MKNENSPYFFHRCHNGAVNQLVSNVFMLQLIFILATGQKRKIQRNKHSWSVCHSCWCCWYCCCCYNCCFILCSIENAVLLTALAFWWINSCFQSTSNTSLCSCIRVTCGINICFLFLLSFLFLLVLLQNIFHLVRFCWYSCCCCCCYIVAVVVNATVTIKYIYVSIAHYYYYLETASK